MNTISIILQTGAVLPAIVGLIFIGNKNKIGFIYNLISWIFWTLLFIYSKLYIMLIIQVFYLVLNIRGYINWRKDEEKNKEVA